MDWEGLTHSKAAVLRKEANAGKCVTGIFWANLWTWQASGTFAAAPYVER